MIQKVLLALLIALSCVWGETVEVKPLTATQVSAIAKAKATLDKAKAEYEQTVDGVKAAFGISSGGLSATLAICHQPIFSAEIVGAFIIIRSDTYDSCGLHIKTPATPIK